MSACKRNGTNGLWFDKTNNDQVHITSMMNKAICLVAGKPTVQQAWDALFRHHNGGALHAKGERIAVKLNLKNGGKYSNQFDASAQTVYALLDGFVNQFGVNQSDIVLCDPARENQCSVVRDYCTATSPHVNYDTNLGGIRDECVLLFRARAGGDVAFEGDRGFKLLDHYGHFEAPLHASRDLS